MRFSGVSSLDLRDRFGFMATAWSSWAFILLIVIFQGLVWLGGGPDELPWIYQNFGLSREGVLSGKIWQLMTYGLLHGSFAHVGFNAFCVLAMGGRIEHMLGPRVMWKTLAFGIGSGGLAQLAISPGGEGGPILVGASGGCMALFLLVTTLSPDSRTWPLRVSARNLAAGVMTAEFLMILIDPALGLPGFSKVGDFLTLQGLGSWFVIGHACHFGAGLAGFLFGRHLLRPRITAERLRRDRERREAAKFR